MRPCVYRICDPSVRLRVHSPFHSPRADGTTPVTIPAIVPSRRVWPRTVHLNGRSVDPASSTETDEKPPTVRGLGCSPIRHERYDPTFGYTYDTTGRGPSDTLKRTLRTYFCNSALGLYTLALQVLLARSKWPASSESAAPPRSWSVVSGCRDESGTKIFV